MASKIQQRFWYARARWNTTRRLGLGLIKSGLDIQKPDELINALVSESVVRQFGLWLKRLLPAGKAVPCMRSAINAFGICAYKYELVDRSYDESEALVLHAESFVNALDRVMRENTPPKETIEHMDAYLSVYDTWISMNEEHIRLVILQKVVSRALQLISRRNPPLNQKTEARMSLFIGGIEELGKLISSSREIGVISRLKASSFWGPGDASVFKMMHEVLIDEAYQLSRDAVFTRFQAEYERVPEFRLCEFLIDLRAVLMFPLRDEAIITELAGVLDFESMSMPEDLMVFAERLMPLIARAAPIASVSQQIADAWRECDRSDQKVMDALREAARSLRYAFALMDLEQCRRSVWRHPNGFHHTQADLLISKSTYTKHTEQWIWRALQGHPHLQRLAKGDPFALLRFHNHEVMRYVLLGNFTAPMPEVLQLDIERMRAIVCDRADIGRVIRMVDSHEVPEDTPQYLKDTAAALRKLLFVCRFQHGEQITKLTQRLARQTLASDEM